MKLEKHDDYRKHMAWQLDWEKVKKDIDSKKMWNLGDQIYNKELITYGKDRKIGIDIDRKSLILMTFKEKEQLKIEKIFSIDGKYDKIDIVNVKGMHLVMARFNEYRDMLIFKEYSEFDNIKVYDSRIVKNSKGQWIDINGEILDPNSELAILMGKMEKV